MQYEPSPYDFGLTDGPEASDATIRAQQDRAWYRTEEIRYQEFRADRDRDAAEVVQDFAPDESYDATLAAQQDRAWGRYEQRLEEQAEVEQEAARDLAEIMREIDGPG
jgi:hypothetical protein